MNIERPYIRDGVDVYVANDEDIHFVFLATRKRVIVKAIKPLIEALAWLDGDSALGSLQSRYAETYGAHRISEFQRFLEYLHGRGIVVEADWLSRSDLDVETVETQARQLSFLLDLTANTRTAVEAQKRVGQAHITCFGLGAVGSWIVRLLLGMGFRRFTLVDHAPMRDTDIARHAFSIDVPPTWPPRAEWVATCAMRDFPGTVAQARCLPLSLKSDLEALIPADTSLIANTADEPYIGSTGVLLSRFCVGRGLPLLVAGGFDAHLASAGEMIIPGVTPCADCYASHFKGSLANWKPSPHPLDDRANGQGGLCSLTAFSAASAALSIFRLLALGERNFEGGRGELHFDDYAFKHFRVERQPDCPYCSHSR